VEIPRGDDQDFRRAARFRFIGHLAVILAYLE
jgi:hypothetical protein